MNLEELEGGYDITYQSDALLDNFFEPGKGYGEIIGNKLVGRDATGISWNADLIIDNNKIKFKAVLDPQDGAPNAFLMSKEGELTKEPQNYSGQLKLTNIDGKKILRTTVQQGPITIHVQFEKIK